MSVRRPAPPIWIADKDGVAHARSHLPSPRTACGIPAIEERYAWPALGRCATCVAVLERAEVARA